MARLTRVRQKVFASNASNNGVFGSLQAGNPQTSNNVATLQSLSAFENGWDDAIEQGDKLPPLEEFQGIQYGLSYQQAYMLQEGIAEWEANTPYYKGSLVKTISGTSFKLYCSLEDNNTNKTVTNTTYWKKVMDSDEAYAYDSAVVHKAGTETITGAKTFSGNITSSGTNTWTGSNTFSNTISGSINGNAGTVTNGVYTTGDQTIAGRKTLTFDPYIKDTSLATNGTTPTSQTQKQIVFKANDDSTTGTVRSRQTTDGRYALDLICSRLVNGTLTNSAISAFVGSDGSTYATAPTPSGVNLNNTMVPTTEWIQSWASTSGGLSTFTKSSKGGFKLKNGLVVNWGRATSGTNTFAIPFYSNTSYSIATATVRDQQTGTAWGQVNTLTTTGFNVVLDSSQTICWVAIGF